jgi:tetratricopeptide (TPR) repeat protein
MARFLRGAAGVVTAALVLGASPPAWAQEPADADAAPLLAEGRRQFEELRLEEALQTLSAAVLRRTSNDADRAEIYRLLAYTYHALGREPEAAGAYLRLLPLQPDFSPGSEVAPRTRAFFERVRGRWEAEGRPGQPPPPPVTLRHRSPAQVPPGEDVELEVSVEGEGALRVASIQLAYRQGTDAVFRRVDTDLADTDRFVAGIPGDDVRPPLVEYYFEALDDRGLPIAAAGDIAAPNRFAVPAAEGGGGVLGQWWFWTIVGVVVVGGVAAGVGIAAANSGGQGTLVLEIE